MKEIGKNKTHILKEYSMFSLIKKTCFNFIVSNSGKLICFFVIEPQAFSHFYFNLFVIIYFLGL